MKKVSSLKKKLVTFGLAVCTFVTSIGVNECAAMNNSAEQNQNQQEGWSACDVIKSAVKLFAAVGVGVAACSYPEYTKTAVSNILNVLWFAIKHYKISGGIALATIIGIMINKLKNFPKTLTDGLNEVKSKRKKLDAEKKKLEEDMQKLKEKLAKNNKDSWKAFGEELISTPKKVVTAGATVVSGAWTCATIGAKGAVVSAKCAVPVMKYAGKAVCLGAKGLYNLLCWIENGGLTFA